MKRHFSLAGLNWELVGTKPYYWKLDRQMERMKSTQPEEKPVPAPVPGSVQQALLMLVFYPIGILVQTIASVNGLRIVTGFIFSICPTELYNMKRMNG